MRGFIDFIIFSSGYEGKPKDDRERGNIAAALPL